MARLVNSSLSEFYFCINIRLAIFFLQVIPSNPRSFLSFAFRPWPRRRTMADPQWRFHLSLWLSQLEKLGKASRDCMNSVDSTIHPQLKLFSPKLFWLNIHVSSETFFQTKPSKFWLMDFNKWGNNGIERGFSPNKYAIQVDYVDYWKEFDPFSLLIIT